jgi:hypothetical protein
MYAGRFVVRRRCEGSKTIEKLPANCANVGTQWEDLDVDGGVRREEDCEAERMMAGVSQSQADVTDASFQTGKLNVEVR